MPSKLYSALLSTFYREKNPLFYTLSKSIISKIYSLSSVNDDFILQISYSTTENEYFIIGVDSFDFLMKCLIIWVATLNLEGLKSFIWIVLVMSKAMNTALMGWWALLCSLGIFSLQVLFSLISIYYSKLEISLTLVFIYICY